MKIKERHEKIVCELFLNEYNKIFNTNYRFIKLSDPPEPDCICSENLNIEILTAYYNRKEAKEIWELARGEITVEEYNRRGHFLKEPDKQFYDFLNKEISKKQEKKYQYNGKLFLVVTEQADLTDKETIKKYITGYKNFENKIFDAVWLLLHEENYYKIFLVS